jgi:hypothetical protein
MMEAQEKTRVQIGLVQPDDDMRQEFQSAIQKQEQSRIDMQFEQMLRPPEPKIDGVTGPTPKPAEGNQPAEVTIQPRSVGQMAGAAVSDVYEGAWEAPKQVVGGVADAVNETIEVVRELDQALDKMLPDGMLEQILNNPVTNPGGAFVEALDMLAEGDFSLPTPAEAETVTGNFVRAASQFLTGFIPAMKGAKALGASGGIATQLGAGAVADAVVFDPHEDRLSTFLNEVPALAPIVPDYLAETDPAKVSELQGRLANAIEGAGLGVATEGLMKAFKYYRAARQAKLQNKPEATAEEAARDAIREAAREELIEPIDDTALRGLGDPDEAAVVIAGSDETLDTALGRIGDAKMRLTEQGVDPADVNAALAKESGLRPRKKAKVFLNMARIKSREDVKEALQLFADADAEAINAKRRGKVSNAQTAREAQKEFTELTDLIGRKPGPMSAAEAVAARRMLTASGEQTVALARKAADPGATSADLYNFRRAMLVHYAIQSEVIAARTETARALQSWSIASRATKGAQGVVCVL